MTVLPRQWLRFGMLRILGRAGYHIVIGRDGKKFRYHRMLVICDCGTRKTVLLNSLKRGVTLSCGCLGKKRRLEANTTHGCSYTREYLIWRLMIRRCKYAKNYADRGIRVCHRWRTSFVNFYSDMGPCPAGLSIERKNNDGDYTPSNCCWATYKDQCNNTRRSRRITLDGDTKTVTQWAETIGIPIARARSRLQRGWPADLALSTITRRRLRTLLMEQRI